MDMYQCETCGKIYKQFEKLPTDCGYEELDIYIRLVEAKKRMANRIQHTSLERFQY